MANSEQKEVGKERSIGRPRRTDDAMKFTVYLPLNLGEWGKMQTGGLSALLTRLLKEEKERQDPRT